MTSESNRDFNIEIEDTTSSSVNDVQLPLNFVTYGEVEHDDVKVYIHQDTYNAIERFSRSDMNRELGSILLGEYSQYSNKMHVVISHHIEAKYTDATASTLTFTHETWDYVHKEHETLYPNQKILGWQHTHPGYGIFLSHYDIFIQENFFNLPFQVAYVVDPKQNLRGFFQWKGGKIEKLKGYYVYDEVGKKIIVSKSGINSKEKNRIDNSSSNNYKKYLVAGGTLLSILVIVIGTMLGLMQSRLDEQDNRQRELENMIASQNQNNVVDSSDGLQLVQEAIVDRPVDPSIVQKIEELVKTVESQQNQIADQAQTITELRELLTADESPQLDSDNRMVFSYYIVKSGDTLIDICAELGIDYATNFSVIKAVNGLDDVSKIYIGQRLIVPIPIE